MPLLKRQLNSMDQLMLIIENLNTDKSLAKKSLKEILDFENKSKSLADCLEKSDLTDSIKDFLLAQEKKNTFLNRKLLGSYKPVAILQNCTLLVATERASIQAKINQINHQPYDESLQACLDALLKNRKKDFYHSEKCRTILVLTKKATQKIANTKKLIAELKDIVKPHRDEKKWYVRTRGKTSTSLSIFNKFFNAQNEPAPIPPNDLKKRNTR